MTGDWPKNTVDHINHDKLDNSWANLRDVPEKINQLNKPKRINRYGRPGLLWDKRRSKWRAKVRLNNKHHELGRFDDILDAINAIDKFHQENGFHPNHGK